MGPPSLPLREPPSLINLASRRFGRISLSRLTVLLGSICFASAFVLALVGLSPGARLLESSRGKLSPTSTLDGEDALPTGPVQPLIPRCGANRTVTSPSIWRDAQAKAAQLRDDKFTYVLANLAALALARACSL